MRQTVRMYNPRDPSLTNTHTHTHTHTHTSRCGFTAQNHSMMTSNTQPPRNDPIKMPIKFPEEEEDESDPGEIKGGGGGGW